MTFRTDLEPLTRRLKLPVQMQSARWVSIPSVNDSGSVPGRTDFYEIYAYLELNEAAWTSLNKFTQTAVSRDSITIPGAAAIIIPPSAKEDFKRFDGGLWVEGPAFDLKTISSPDAKSTAEKAIRVGSALVVQMTVY